MDKEQIFFIGPFPGAYGGVTVKNNMLAKILNNNNKIVVKFDTESIYKKNIIKNFIDLIIFIIKNKDKKGIISISSNSLIKLTKIIYILNRDIMKNTTVFVAGGQIHNLIKKSNTTIREFKLYKNIYVEANAMKDELMKLGLQNVNVVPNCREIEHERKIYIPDGKKIKCLFLSRICKGKGVNLILDASKQLNKKEVMYKIDFYGPIKEDFFSSFDEEISKNKNIEYKGIIRPEKQNVYDIINKYDVLLFPTCYDCEGVPGIISEAKIAGIPIIASSKSYNTELIKNMYDGIILQENTAENIADAIQSLYKDCSLRNELRKNSFKSGEYYIISKYIKNIINNL